MFAVFSPNSHDSGDGSDGYYNTTLFLSSNADNSILYNTPYGHAVGTYAPYPLDPCEWMAGQTQPPDLLGTVHADHWAALNAHFVWTGPGPASDATFLVQTHLGATAGGDYGTSGKTSGLSATGTALVPSFGEQVTASLTGTTADSASLDGRHLVRVSGAGGLATVTLQANVTTDTGNSLPFSLWSDGEAEGGTSYYAPNGNLNGRTSANASASVSATANYDSREVVLYRDGARGETTDPDGTVHGDTIYSYEEYDNNGVDNSLRESHHVNWQTFHPAFTGMWFFLSMYVYPPDDTEGYEPDNFAWTWTPNESQDTYRTGHWAVIDGGYELFDGQWEGSPSGVQQRQIVYTATDSDGATATATYILKMHDPYEWSPNGPAYEVAPTLIGSSDSADPTEAGSTISVYYPPVAGSYNVGETWKAGGAILTTAGAAAPFAAEALGPWTIPVTSLLAGSGYVAGTYAPDADKHHTDAPSNVGDFINDLSDQANINQGNTAGIVYPSQPRFTDTGLAQMIHDTNTADSWYRGLPIGTDSSGNPYPAGAWKFTAVAVLHQNRQDYIADTYDAAGKTGPVPGHVMIPTNVEPIRTWTYYPAAAPGGR